MTEIVKTRNLSKSYDMGELKVEALKDVSIRIEEGSFTSIMGPSGSGKSTLMHLVGLLDSPTSGEVIISGSETSHLKDRQKARLRLERIGFIFQFYSLLKGFTALENVSMPLIMKGESRKKAREKAAESLKKVKLEDRMNHTTDELSGGQRQRVAIARALVNKPDILLADEPASQLDTVTSEEIIELFQQIAEEGRTVVSVNHEKRLGEKADRIIWLEDGKIKER